MDTTKMFEPKFTPVDRSQWSQIEDRWPTTLFAKNRARFFALFHKHVETKQGDFAVFKGANEVPIYSSDISYPEY